MCMKGWRNNLIKFLSLPRTSSMNMTSQSLLDGSKSEYMRAWIINSLTTHRDKNEENSHFSELLLIKLKRELKKSFNSPHIFLAMNVKWKICWKSFRGGEDGNLCERNLNFFTPTLSPLSAFCFVLFFPHSSHSRELMLYVVVCYVNTSTTARRRFKTRHLLELHTSWAACYIGCNPPWSIEHNLIIKITVDGMRGQAWVCVWRQSRSRVFHYEELLSRQRRHFVFTTKYKSFRIYFRFYSRPNWTEASLLTHSHEKLPLDRLWSRQSVPVWLASTKRYELSPSSTHSSESLLMKIDEKIIFGSKKKIFMVHETHRRHWQCLLLVSTEFSAAAAWVSSVTLTQRFGTNSLSQFLCRVFFLCSGRNYVDKWIRQDFSSLFPFLIWIFVDSKICRVSLR